MKRTLTGAEAFSKMLIAPLPEKTKTYTPIGHADIINRVRSEIRSAGFSVSAEAYRCSSDGLVALGSMMINYKADPDIVLSANFVNSYNKQFAFRFSLGGVDLKTGSTMIPDDKTFGYYKRLHKGTADVLAAGKIQEIINGADEYWLNILESKSLFMRTFATIDEAYAHAATLFFKTGILNTMQMNTIKSLFKNYLDETKEEFISLYDFHNIIGQALKDAHPSEWLDHQIKLHSYLWNITKPHVEDLDEVFDESDTEKEHSETYRLPTAEEWEESYNVEVTDELP